MLPRCSKIGNCLKEDTSKYAISIVAGIVFGIILNAAEAGHVLSTLITIPGPMFLRALQCAVIPMMFFNISVSIAQIYGEGNAGSLGKKVIKFYLLTTLLAVMNGIIMANMYSSLFTSEKEEEDDGSEFLIVATWC
jgi:Na+/H+-dicarboxylate symporter